MGYQYVIEAIMMYYDDPTINFVDGIYATLASTYSRDTGKEIRMIQVERNIRHFIHNTIICSSQKQLNYFFGNMLSGKKAFPTNSEFIAAIADRLR